MISVIIPTRDRPGPLHRALRSLARQTFRDFEVIVVADGGRSPRPVVDAWSNQLPITLLDAGGRGVSHARNLGIAAADGQYLAFLDDDDIHLPHHLQTAHRALAADRADLVYGGALVSPRWIEALPRAQATLPRKDYPFDDTFLLVANYIHTSSVVTRNFTATPVRFDEQMSHCEDWDMWLALRHRADYRFAYLDECTSVYHQVPHTSSVVASAYQTSPTPFTRARTHLYRKWPLHPTDQLTVGYRDWFGQFDARLDTLIAYNQKVRPHVYEHAVRGLHTTFTAGIPADPALLDTLVPPPSQPLPTTGDGSPSAHSGVTGHARR